MRHATTLDEKRRARDLADARTRLRQQTDLLVDAIAGEARSQLEGQPVLTIYHSICRQLREMGLEPAEAKVYQVACWISGEDGPDLAPPPMAA
jgi:hypothetical protein